MEQNENKISFEQIIAAALVNYKKELTAYDVVELLALFRKYTTGRYEFTDGDISRIEMFLAPESGGYRLKEGLNLEMPVVEKEPDFTIKLALALIAGPEALGYTAFFASKGCQNCLNPSCSVPSNEKIGLDEQNMPQGNKCVAWENGEYKEKALAKTNQYLYK